jgi:thiol-disulfide isomerase/thioredoxin
LKENFLISSLLLFAFVVPFSSTSLLAQSASADVLFSQAKTEALNTHKNILLVFSASWCGPCKMYEHFLEDP